MENSDALQEMTSSPAPAISTNCQPLLFQTDMVQAYKKGWKTVTRRMKGLETFNVNPNDWEITGEDRCADSAINLARAKTPTPFRLSNKITGKHMDFGCPYGMSGDRLYIRESFWNYGRWMRHAGGNGGKGYTWKQMTVDQTPPFEHFVYAADTDKPVLPIKPLNNSGFRKIGSIYLPKSKVRFFLRITSVQVEQLREVTEASARSEGIYRWGNMDDYFQYLRDLPAGVTSNIWPNELRIRETIEANLFAVPGRATSPLFYKDYLPQKMIHPAVAVTDNAVQSYIGLFWSINELRHKKIDHPLNNPWVWVINFEATDMPDGFCENIENH